MTIEEIEVALEAASIHQSSEWGMRDFQALFPQIQDPISMECRGQCKLMMKLRILLSNMCTRKWGSTKY